MSNRTLIVTVVILVLSFVGVVGAARIYQNSQPQEGPAKESNNVQPTDLKFADDAKKDEAQKPETKIVNGTCERDFSDSKLAANGNIKLSGRQAQINVKDFGSITVEFFDQDAPKAVENFLRLSDSGYYNCLTFHRVAKGFVIQGGDPNGNGSGGQSAFGQPFQDELNPATESYKTGYVKGVLAMANSGPNTNGSQFFITTADDTKALQHAYTIFGKVVSGMDVADKIGQLETNPPGDGAPVKPVIIESVKIIK